MLLHRRNRHTAGSGSYAGGLVGYNTGTIDASFSHATVDIEMEAGAIDGSTNVYAGGVAGHNEGTLTATYTAGAVKGKGGSDSSVGGLVGYNTLADDAPSGAKTIIASYSIAPVTSVAYATTTNPPKPTVGGLTGCCTYSTTTNTIIVSYWDYISSGIDDTSPTTMPQGKSTRDLTSPARASGIYAAWNTLTIDGTNDVEPWGFDNARRFHPLLKYGCHTTDQSGNQNFVYIGLANRSDKMYHGEGMTLYSTMWSFRNAFREQRRGALIWEGSTDGITWSLLISTLLKSYGAGRTSFFVPRSEHEGKYIHAKAPLAGAAATLMLK